jgi:hypothetical protein
MKMKPNESKKPFMNRFLQGHSKGHSYYLGEFKQFDVHLLFFGANGCCDTNELPSFVSEFVLNTILKGIFKRYIFCSSRYFFSNS